MPDRRILLGVIGRAHGVRGLVRVTSHTADPADLTAYGPLIDEQGRRFALTWRGDGIAEVSELVGATRIKVTDRTAAEQLTNTRLYVERAALPEAAENEYYLADLIGALAVGSDGERIGTVSVVHDYGAGASLEIERVDAPPLIVPLTAACVPDVDAAGRRVTVAPPEEVAADIAAAGMVPSQPAATQADEEAAA